MKIPRIIGHRGSPKAAPENTLASFRRAAADGARWVEFDVALTSDARPVIFHDDTLERTSDGEGVMAETPFDIVKQLDAGSWFSPAFAGELVPTLEETLELLAELGLGFNMELKTDPGRETELAEIALPVAQNCWPTDAPVPLISSFAREAVVAAQKIAPAWPRDVIFDRIPGDWRALGEQLDLAAFGANHKNLTREQVMEVRGAGYALTSYTVNDRARAETLFGWGVDAIFTDVPGEMIKAFP